VFPPHSTARRLWCAPQDGVQARSRQLGRTVPAQLITEAQLTGYKPVRLDSPDFMTAAHSLYRASGFKDIGPYPESEIPDEYKPHWIFMERNLI
jgi:hypothetical protein